MRLTELHALFPDAAPIKRGEFRARCPAHAGKTDTSLSVKASDNGRILLCCRSGCGTDEIVTALGLSLRDLFDVEAPPVSRVPGIPPAREQELTVDDLRKRRIARDLWSRAQSITGGPAAEYLVRRKVVIPPADGDLRWLPDLQLFGQTGPALVGRISDIEDASRGLGLHLTWLKRDAVGWARAERRILGRKRGGCIRLWPSTGRNPELGVAEGIETALAAAKLRQKVPFLSVLDAQGMGCFPVLEGVAALIVAVDRDQSGVGQRAGLEVGKRWQAAGRRVDALMPSRVGWDIADEVLHG